MNSYDMKICIFFFFSFIKKKNDLNIFIIFWFETWFIDDLLKDCSKKSKSSILSLFKKKQYELKKKILLYIISYKTNMELFHVGSIWNQWFFIVIK